MEKYHMASTKRGYSRSELKLIEILRKNRGSPMSSKKIATIHYLPEEAPVNAVRSVVTTLNNVIKKSKRRRECFIIRKTERSGPNPVQFWMEDR